MKKATHIMAGAFVVLFLLQVSSGKQQLPGVLPLWGGAGPSTPIRLDQDYGKIPLHFVPNYGQIDGAGLGKNLPGPSDMRLYTAGGHLLGFREDGVVIASGTAFPDFAKKRVPGAGSSQTRMATYGPEETRMDRFHFHFPSRRGLSRMSSGNPPTTFVLFR